MLVGLVVKVVMREEEEDEEDMMGGDFGCFVWRWGVEGLKNSVDGLCDESGVVDGRSEGESEDILTHRSRLLFRMD